MDYMYSQNDCYEFFQLKRAWQSRPYVRGYRKEKLRQSEAITEAFNFHKMKKKKTMQEGGKRDPQTKNMREGNNDVHCYFAYSTRSPMNM